MSHILPQFLRSFDPLKHGFGDTDFAELGYPLTRGYEFPATVDVILLMRRELYPTPGLWHYCGQTEAGESTVQNADGYPHLASMGYQYAAAFCHPNGFCSVFSEPVRVDFDGGNDVIDPPLPMWPIQIVATPIAGGKFKITWVYDPWGQGAYPADFLVFGNTGAAMNWLAALTDSETGLNYTPYVPNRQTYSFTTPAYGDGTAKFFGVRARSSVGAREQNTFTTTSMRARAAAPAKGEIRSAHQRRV